MADIVIRGIDISENLDMILNACDNKIWYSKYNGKTWEEGGVWKSADFIILPEGYGRLIDADKLTPDIVNYIAGGYGTVGSMCTLRGYSQQKIDNAPTILKAEVKKDERATCHE